MVEQFIHAVTHHGHHGRHIFDYILGVVGVGAGASAVLGLIQGGLGVLVALVSLAVVVVRLQINLMEKREKEKAQKDDESA